MDARGPSVHIRAVQKRADKVSQIYSVDPIYVVCCFGPDICCSDFDYRGFKLVNVHSLSTSQGISTTIIVIIISIISMCICSEKRGYP